MATDFSALNEIATLADGDRFVADDVSEVETRKVLASTIKAYVLSGLTSTMTELNLNDGALALDRAIDVDETLSADQSKTITGLVAGKRYRLEFELLGVAGTLNHLALRFGNSGGIDTGANYNWAGLYGLGGSTSSGSGDTYVRLTPSTYFNAGDWVFGSIEFVLDDSDDTKAIGKSQGIKGGTDMEVTFYYNGASTVDRIQITNVTGGVQGTMTGRIRLYQTN